MANRPHVASDLIALMDALRIDKAILAGFDWGARSANIVAALWPERCKAMVSVSGYLIGNQEAGKMPLPPKNELEWWYQYYFATERGRVGYDKYRHDFAKLIWQIASPQWKFDDATFDRSAAAFDNPDHVAIVIHNYRWRLALARRRAQVRRSGKAVGRRPGHHRAHHYARRRCQWRATSGTQRLCQEILRQVRASDHHGRHRPQSPAGSAAGLRPGGHRRRPLLTQRALAFRLREALMKSHLLLAAALIAGSVATPIESLAQEPHDAHNADCDQLRSPSKGRCPLSPAPRPGSTRHR